MALSANTAWEVRPTNGSDTNGGGFVAGSGGTDYSQQNAAQLSISDAACSGTSSVTSVTGGFTAAMVGNIMYLSSGPGWYQITSRANSNQIGIDRSGPNASGMTANVGGALKTTSAAAAAMVGSNKVFVKAEATITITSTITLAPPSGNPSKTVPYTRFIGYNSARGDNGRVTIKLSTNSGLTGLLCNSDGMTVENFFVDCSSLGNSTGIDLEGAHQLAVNCKVAAFTTRGIYVDGNNQLAVMCEATAGTSAASEAINVTGTIASKVLYCNVHDNACPGIAVNANSASVIGNLITNNSGASSDGIITTSSNTLIISNTIYNSGQHGINISSQYGIEESVILNNILASSGGYGLNFSSGAGVAASSVRDGNAYWNNSSGTRHNCDDTSTNPINGVSPYANTLDIVITDGSPFTNAAGGDFTLNNTALRGALIRGHGILATLPGATGTSYFDMGAFQHQDPSSSVIVVDDD
jgi:hypothetical protein